IRIGASRWLDACAGRKRRLSRRRNGRDEGMAVNEKSRAKVEADLIARVRAAARQEQFLEVVSAEEARARFERHLDLSALPAESVTLADVRTRVLAGDVVAAVD